MNWVLALTLMVSTVPLTRAAEGAASTAAVGARARCGAALKDYRRYYARTLTAVRGALKKHAPELLRETPRTMPTAARPGYGVLPALVPPRALNVAGAGDDAHVNGGMLYSWDLTAQYAAREVKALEEVEAKIAALARLDDKADRRAILKGVVDVDLPQLERGFALVDRHEKHNEFWQAEIGAHRSRYEEGSRLFQLVREGKGGADVDRVKFQLQCKPPIRVKNVVGAGSAGEGSEQAIFIDIYTDIANRAWLARFGDVVEGMWSMAGVRLRVQWRHVVPKPAPRAGAVLADEEAWVGRFPRKGAVLTTGATATHALPCRAVVLGPFALEESAAAHEFGHILGFNDAYIRGFRELGPGEGVEIQEIVPDPSDIMAKPESGVVQPGHISALLR